MTIPAIIRYVGSIREFDITSNGLTKKQKAVEVTLESGGNWFVAEGYGDVADAISQHAQVGSFCLAELVFGIREIERKDGSGKYLALKATVAAISGI